MKWIKLDPDNLPKGEVLAKNKRNKLLIGYLDDGLYCESVYEQIDQVTHYIPVSELLKRSNDEI